MRHRVSGSKLNLPGDQRLALLHGLARSLIMYGAIETTEPRAKAARIVAEKLITTAKQNTVHARREARKILPARKMPDSLKLMHGLGKKAPAGADASKSALAIARKEFYSQDPVKYLFDEVAPKFADKNGGYTRMTKIGFRRGDASPMVKLELAVD